MKAKINPVLSFELTPAPPFRLDLAVWALRREPNNILDRWDGKTYRRTVAQEDALFEISVEQKSAPDNPVLEVQVRGSGDCLELKKMATHALERLLGLTLDLSDFYRFAASHKELKGLAERFCGVKPPRFLSLFETLVNGIIFQQISLPAGMSILNRLVENHGLAAQNAAGSAFPLPETIASLTAEDLRALGISRQKGRALTELTAMIANNLNLEQTETMGDSEALSSLCRLRGVGRWTAQYFLLRGLGRTHILPGDDVGAQNKIKKWLELEQAPDYGKMKDLKDKWHPYGGMVYFHLLLNHLAEKGHIT